MEAIIFIGIQASGKSTFYQSRFFHTHLRLSLDMLKTRHREEGLLRACLTLQQPFVVDNTNPTVADRARYLLPARAAGFRVAGYYFESRVTDCIRRNNTRPAGARVPPQAIGGTFKRLAPPVRAEGFDALYYVQVAPEGGFLVSDWPEEAP